MDGHDMSQTTESDVSGQMLPTDDVHADEVVRISGLRKVFEREAGVREFSATVCKGELVSLIGPSGCGKTTVLRSVAGLEQPDSGIIEIDHKRVFDSTRRHSTAPDKRGVSMVFQHYALWPHMNVYENVAFGLKTRKTPRREIPEYVERALRQVQLWDKRDAAVSHLSGGQQQRASLARALAFGPNVVLLDEPLSNLDAKLREEMRLELRALQQRLEFSAIYVTHDQDEAMALSSHIVVMNAGRIEQVGVPEEIWRRPATPFVAGFFGATNRLVGEIVGPAGADLLRIRTDSGLLLDVEAKPELQAGNKVELFVRSNEVRLSTEEVSGAGSARAVVRLLTFMGDDVIVEVQVGTDTIMVRCPPTSGLATGSDVGLIIPPSGIKAYAYRPKPGG